MYEREPARWAAGPVGQWTGEGGGGDADRRVRIGPQGARALYACLPPEAWEEFTAGAEGGGPVRRS